MPDDPKTTAARIRRALDLDGPSHARLNLEGALIDLDYRNADKICRETIARVLRQLAEVEMILEAAVLKNHTTAEAGGCFTGAEITAEMMGVARDAFRMVAERHGFGGLLNQGFLSNAIASAYLAMRRENAGSPRRSDW